MVGVLSIILTFLCISISVQSLPLAPPVCPPYARYSKQRHPGNQSVGIHQLPYQRPDVNCRKFYSQEVEDAILQMRDKIQDPDLFRLFENAYPNTLDTAIRWTGFAYADGPETKYTDEDLAFVITGDMYASYPPRSRSRG